MKLHLLLTFLVTTCLSAPLPADPLDDLCGRYIRQPAENGWHTGDITRPSRRDENLRWTNQAEVSWDLLPDLPARVLRTNESNPYHAGGAREFTLIDRGGRVIGFRFGDGTFLRDGEHLLEQNWSGLHGYITCTVEQPPPEFGYGYSFYVTLFELTRASLEGFQVGLAGTWICPDNDDFQQPLCPPGTFARDNWPERGPTYGEVFQTIEGSLGQWTDTHFGTVAPKFRMSGTVDGYTSMLNSVGWPSWSDEAAPPNLMAVAQLSNRLLVPPDGFTFDVQTPNPLLGYAWMALPLVPAEKTRKVTTGDKSWTLFLNTTNFRGPVVFWVPDGWSRLSRNYKTITSRGLDSRPGIATSFGMEIASMPCVEARDGDGVLYRRIPQISFPHNQQGQTILLKNVNAYSTAALYDQIKSFTDSGQLGDGRFNLDGAFYPKLAADGNGFDQGGTPIAGIDSALKSVTYGRTPTQAFGINWASADFAGHFPEYFKEADGQMLPLTADEVPPELGLTGHEFTPLPPQTPYVSPEDPTSLWKSPGPVAGPFQATISDGSVITYSWYRFIDQPTILAQQWSNEKRERLQSLVEQIHRDWTIDRDYLPPPTRGQIATLDGGLLVTPPEGLEAGYVPIVTGQAMPGTEAEAPAPADQPDNQPSRHTRRRSQPRQN